MTTESIIAIIALTGMAIAICWIIRIGRKEAEMIFEADYENLDYFIKHCDVNEKNEATISRNLYRLSNMPGADVEKLQVLNKTFRDRFVPPTLSDIVADHENY